MRSSNRSFVITHREDNGGKRNFEIAPSRIRDSKLGWTFKLDDNDCLTLGCTDIDTAFDESPLALFLNGLLDGWEEAGDPWSIGWIMREEGQFLGTASAP